MIAASAQWLPLYLRVWFGTTTTMFWINQLHWNRLWQNIPGLWLCGKDNRMREICTQFTFSELESISSLSLKCYETDYCGGEVLLIYCQPTWTSHANNSQHCNEYLESIFSSFFFVQIKYIKIHEFQLSVECCRFKCFGIIFYLSLFSCINWADDDKSKVANMSILLRTNNDGH